MTRNTWTTAVVLVGTLSLAGAQAFAADAKADDAGKLISVTATPNTGRSDLLYTVPLRSRLLVTQACVEHPAMGVDLGHDRVRITYGNTGCTDFGPGFAVAGGQDIYCDNHSGLERTCALVGILEKEPEPVGKRVRFYDLK
jgi:hypothetical protein